jgi:hypothetical protein
MGLTGRWVNSYNSVMQLVQADTLITGVYTSQTGSTGAYLVAGYAGIASNADFSVGQPLALSIYWRSIEEGKPDPSWHYVSGLSGQLVLQGKVPTLLLLHDMVATTIFPKVVPQAGTYLDKLIYTPGQAKTPVPDWPEFAHSPVEDPVTGQWVSQEASKLQLTLEVLNANYGYVLGTFQKDEVCVPVVGFTDTHVSVSKNALQGLTVSMLLPGDEGVASLSGKLDSSSDTLDLFWMQSQGTASNSTWIQTQHRSLVMKRKAR